MREAYQQGAGVAPPVTRAAYSESPNQVEPHFLLKLALSEAHALRTHRFRTLAELRLRLLLQSWQLSSKCVRGCPVELASKAPPLVLLRRDPAVRVGDVVDDREVGASLGRHLPHDALDVRASRIAYKVSHPHEVTREHPMGGVEDNADLIRIPFLLDSAQGNQRERVGP